jgi:hypothetical protein
MVIRGRPGSGSSRPVETIAQLPPDAPADVRLQDDHPVIAERLALIGDQELLELVTAQLADQAKVARKFRDFLARFEPKPLKPRPAPPDRVDWSTLKEHVKKIYGYRSKDLHEGVPLPSSMCTAPRLTSSGTAAEVGDPSADKPQMHLHVFEHIVRSALLSWWRSTAAAEATT